MSDQILQALMRLFAIIAKVDLVNEENENVLIDSVEGKNTIRVLLESELSSEDVNKYLNVFEAELNKFQGKLFRRKGTEKRTSSNSVKVLRICKELNSELQHEQKVIIILCLLEFINTENRQTQKELDFIETVAMEFNIKTEEYQRIRQLIINDLDRNQFVLDEFNLYFIPKEFEVEDSKLFKLGGLDSPIRVIWIPSANLYFFRYFGKEDLTHNGRLIPSKTNIFYSGSWISTPRIKKIYFTDVVKKMTRPTNPETIELTANDISFSFPDNNIGLRPISFSSNESTFISIMGDSGTGKSTLLKLLSGEIKPTEGNITVNGLDLQENKKDLAGLFGVVSQEDQLVSELTVYANLMYAGMLTLGHLSHQEIRKRVVKVLKTLGLFDIRKLKVGSKQDKIISGGQRKRLNIALELIREPKILLVDEPTSGLSSRDSELIIDILKELCLNGTLVISVIHQPSSNIFKLFDRLLILDKGGYVVYDGIPLNAPVHFKTHSFQGNPDEQECRVCGNVNREQIFSLIDRKIVDEKGRPTKNRRIKPKEWNKIYHKNKHNFDTQKISTPPTVENDLPSKLKQFSVYFQRDGATKIANFQYVLINFLIAPMLAVVLAFCTKFFGAENGEVYSFYSNENIPTYIFMATIVAIFLGLNTSAEEIIKEKSTIAREKRMQLSRSAYLLSKLAVLFFISAVQILLFILIGNYLLEIKGLTLSYWFILTSTACACNVLGLLISSIFNSAKVIYIAIPIIIIPQLLFSGVIVPFNKLHPAFAKKTGVPFIGNTQISRWAYEGLITRQATANNYSEQFFKYNVELSHVKWKRDFWIPEIRKQLDGFKNLDAYQKNKFITELTKEDDLFKTIDANIPWGPLSKSLNITGENEIEINKFLDKLRYYYAQRYNNIKAEESELTNQLGQENIKSLIQQYTNPRLNQIVEDKFNTTKFLIKDGEIVRTDTPIYHPSKERNFLNAQFYSPSKTFFGITMSTYWGNVIVIWSMAIFSYIVLYFSWINLLFNWVYEKRKQFLEK